MHRGDSASNIEPVEHCSGRAFTPAAHGAGAYSVLGVLLHHAPRAEARRDRQDRLRDDRQPAARDPVRVAVVEGRHDLRARAARRAPRRRRRRRRRCRRGRGPAFDQPAVLAGVAFGPPAVADAQVRHAVDRRLHAARAARLERLARVVQPDVAALHEEVRDVQVVVVDEGDRARRTSDRARAGRPAAGGACRSRRPDAPCRRRRSARAGAAALRIARQPIGVVEDQLRPLVAGEAAREADRQRVGIEQRAGGDDARRR